MSRSRRTHTPAWLGVQRVMSLMLGDITKSFEVE